MLHGYYAKYLDIFFQVLPSDQLLVVDYAAFAVDPAAVMDEVARHLGLDPRPSANFSGFNTSLVFNTRENRGTHARGYGGKVGGAMSAAIRPGFANKGSFDASWEAGISPGARAALHRYYERPNAELRALLLRQGKPSVSWATAEYAGKARL